MYLSDPIAAFDYIRCVNDMRAGRSSLPETNTRLRENEWQLLQCHQLEDYNPFLAQNWDIALSVSYVLKCDERAALDAFFRYKQIGCFVWNDEDWARAFRLLKGALQAGRVNATGTPLEGGERKAISPVKWHDLDWIRVASAEVIARRGEKIPTYRGVLFCAREVKHLARELHAKGPIGVASAESECRRALTEMMREAPNDPRPKKEVYAELGQTIGWRPFTHAWASAKRDARAPTWGAPGRRRQKRIETPHSI